MMAEVTVTLANVTPCETIGLNYAMSQANAPRLGRNDQKALDYNDEVTRITEGNAGRAEEDPPLAPLPLPSAPSLEKILETHEEYLSFMLADSVIPSWVREEATQTRRSCHFERRFEQASENERQAAMDALPALPSGATET